RDFTQRSLTYRRRASQARAHRRSCDSKLPKLRGIARTRMLAACFVHFINALAAFRRRASADLGKAQLFYTTCHPSLFQVQAHQEIPRICSITSESSCLLKIQLISRGKTQGAGGCMRLANEARPIPFRRALVIVPSEKPKPLCSDAVDSTFMSRQAPLSNDALWRALLTAFL